MGDGKSKNTHMPIFHGDVISMHRYARLNPAHRLPNNHCIHAGNVPIGRRFKRLVRQAHGLIKKLLMVHGWIVGLLDSAEHSYFPRFV